MAGDIEMTYIEESAFGLACIFAGLVVIGSQLQLGLRLIFTLAPLDEGLGKLQRQLIIGYLDIIQAHAVDIELDTLAGRHSGITFGLGLLFKGIDDELEVGYRIL